MSNDEILYYYKGIIYQLAFKMIRLTLFGVKMLGKSSTTMHMFNSIIVQNNSRVTDRSDKKSPWKPSVILAWLSRVSRHSVRVYYNILHISQKSPTNERSCI